MKFASFGIAPEVVHWVAENLVERYDREAFEKAMQMSELAFAAGEVKASKAMWLAARDIAAAGRQKIEHGAQPNAAPDDAMTDWLIHFSDPLKLRNGLIAQKTETGAFSDAAVLWRQGLILLRIEAPDGEDVSFARFWAWLAAYGDTLGALASAPVSRQSNCSGYRSFPLLRHIMNT